VGGVPDFSSQSSTLSAKDLVLKYFFMTLYFLKCYPREHELSVLFRVDEKTARRWIKFYTLKIQGLKHQTIVWNLEESDKIFIVSMDGIHC
jgi:hypothetical protein